MWIMSTDEKPENAVVLRQKKSSGLSKVQKLKRRISDGLGRLSSLNKDNRKSRAASTDLLNGDIQWQTPEDIATPDSDTNFLHSWERLHLSEGDGLDQKSSVKRAVSVASDSRLLDISSANGTYKAESIYGREDAYVRMEQLGEGSYATVFKGVSNLTGQEVALKEIRLQEEEGAPFTAIREASLLRDLRHANIVTLHDIVHTKTSLTLVFEYVAGDLSQYLEKHPGGLVANNVRLLLFQLLRGLAYCHHRKILHRDLKPQNLLLSSAGELKLADFGLARAQSVPSHTYSPEVVTLWYRPPDVLLGTTNYTATLDIWGTGCVFVEILTGHPAFPGAKDAYDQLDKIFQVLGTPTEATWPGVSQLPSYKPAKLAFHRAHRLGRAFPRLYDISNAESLAIKLLQLRPEARPSARDAMRHEFFSCLPAELFSLPDQLSIFTVSGVQWSREARNHPPAVLRVAQDLRRQR
ncbi:cyclin-dependent kinase 14-like isoform X2 [Artemia franciscana]|uniref:cyclin-dependent kinase 14-like isoform X2 n=1 Tax=Artemia franciscana TaxID=6661 RepID=UPI0032DA74B0